MSQTACCVCLFFSSVVVVVVVFVCLFVLFCIKEKVNKNMMIKKVKVVF